MTSARDAGHGLVGEQKKETTTFFAVTVVFIAAVALLLRSAWVVWGRWEAGDSSWYLQVAKNIRLHHAFSADSLGLQPTTFRPPLYPAVIAVLWFSDSPPINLVLIVQALLGAATAALIYLIARNYFKKSVALIAALGFALAPMSGHFTAVVLTETLFTFLLTLGAYLWGNKHYSATGVIFGLAALTRPTMLPFLVFLLLLTLVPAFRSQRRAHLLIVFVALAVGSLWVIRNAVVFHRFVPITAAGYGTNLLLGTLEKKTADNVPARKAFLAGFGTTADETENDRLRLRAAIDRMRENPAHWLRVRAQQYPRLFIDSGSYLFADESVSLRTVLQNGPVTTALVRLLMVLLNLITFLLALLALVAGRHRLVSLSHLALFPIFLVLVHLPTWIEPRYGLPMMPFIAILAADGFVLATGPIVSRRKGRKLLRAE